MWMMFVWFVELHAKNLDTFFSSFCSVNADGSARCW